MSIEFPDNPSHEDVHVFDEARYIYDSDKNKWTSLISYGTNSVTAASFANPTNLSLLTSNGILLKRLYAPGSDQTGIIPFGVITLWYGDLENIPAGWVLCDGNNNTPDLTDKFIMGAGGSHTPGQTGGSADAIIPEHNHTAVDAGHTHNIRAGGGQGAGIPDYDPTDGNSVYLNYQSDPGFANITVQDTGEDPTGKNIPPFYALAYIMRVFEE